MSNTDEWNMGYLAHASNEPCPSGANAGHSARSTARPHRSRGIRHFTGTIPSNPYEGCALTLRRLEAFGMLGDGDADQWVDVLAENGDIIHEIPVTSRGFEYLRRTLKFQREA